MQWVAIILIYSLLIFSTIMLERFIKKKFQLPKKLKGNKRTFTEVLLVIIAVIGCVLANISRYENGNFHPINPIPMYLWLAIYMLVLYGFRGFIARRYAKESNEHYYQFTFAIWIPILLILAFHISKNLFV
ncbi:DUF4181 domain-containing protein [Psychrobacillus sp. NPDC096426]|uniref:DUF4181 domain-containing protein n=1 Tax=Psychrobacillus sp. NPDC096426 TaxID=3364491 RepID=UPI003801E957